MPGHLGGTAETCAAHPRERRERSRAGSLNVARLRKPALQRLLERRGDRQDRRERSRAGPPNTTARAPRCKVAETFATTVTTVASAGVRGRRTSHARASLALQSFWNGRRNRRERKRAGPNVTRPREPCVAKALETDAHHERHERTRLGRRTSHARASPAL